MTICKHVYLFEVEEIPEEEAQSCSDLDGPGN